MSSETKTGIASAHVEGVETDDHVAELEQKLTLESEPEVQEDYKLTFRTIIAIVALALPNCCAVVTNTTNTTISYQVQSVGSPHLSSWIANANFILTLAFGPVFGSLSDRLGKKWFMVGGCAVGIIGSCISGSAPTMPQLIAGNVLTGVANAGCIVSIAANQEVTKNRWRPLAMGVNQTFASCIAVLGVFIAAAFVENNTGGNGGWRWAYYFNAIFYGLAGAGVLLTYFPPPTTLRRHHTLAELFGSVDFGGIAILMASLVSLVIGLTWGGAAYTWSAAQVVAPLVCGCAGLVLFGLWEWRVKSDGLFDHRLMRGRNFPIALFVCTIDGMLLLGTNVLYAQEIAQLFSHDAVRIAAILSPFLVTSAFGCLPFGYLTARTKRFRVMLVAALAWCSLFTGLMALINPDRLAMACVFSALFGIATAVTTVIPISVLSLSIPSYLLGTAGAISISCRALGGIVGTTLFTAIFNNKYSGGLAVVVPAAVAQSGSASSAPQLVPEIMGTLLSGNPQALFELTDVPPKVLGAVEGVSGSAQVFAWKYVWIAIATVVGANAVVACFLQPVGERMNQHVESALEKSKTRSEQMKIQV